MKSDILCHGKISKPSLDVDGPLSKASLYDGRRIDTLRTVLR